MSDIPKTIHYCWFGEGSKSKTIKMCMESWKTNLNDYKIVEWNEKNFNINRSDFAKKAYEAKKYAFVADYCRINVLYNEGGVYLDTDMEIVKNLDSFLRIDAFLGKENEDEVNAAIWGCKKHDPFIKKVLDYYDKLNFDDYIDDLNELAIPKIITKLLVEEGYKNSDEIETLKCGTIVYPKEFFYPKYHEWEEAVITNRTFSIHHYEGSWRSKYKIFRSKFKVFLIDIFGYKIVNELVDKVKSI